MIIYGILIIVFIKNVCLLTEGFFQNIGYSPNILNEMLQHVKFQRNFQ